MTTPWSTYLPDDLHGERVSPRNDWVLVEMDPIPETRGSLILPHGDRVRKGTVLAVGKGRYDEKGVRQPVGLEPGERVAFFREHLEHKQGKAILHILKDFGEDIGLIRANDILFAFVGDVEVTV